MKGLASIALAAAHLAEAEEERLRSNPQGDEGEGRPSVDKDDGPDDNTPRLTPRLKEPCQKEPCQNEVAPRPFAGFSVLVSADSVDATAAANPTPWAAACKAAAVVSRSISLDSSDSVPTAVDASGFAVASPPNRAPTDAPSSTSSTAPPRSPSKKKKKKNPAPKRADSPPLSSPPPPPPHVVATTAINDNDVLCGRGGETNHHPGNVRYRSLVKSHQRAYLAAKRRDKPKIARRIVDIVRSRSPPGRFLKRDAESGGWRDVGNDRAREKTSQALREGAPEIRDAKGGGAASNAMPSSPNAPGANATSVPKESSSDAIASSPTATANAAVAPEERGTPPPPMRHPAIESKKRKPADGDAAPSARIMVQPPPQQWLRMYEPSPPAQVTPHLSSHHRHQRHPYLPFAITNLPPPPYLSSPTFPATVSADDEDCASSPSAASPLGATPSASPPVISHKVSPTRGPRLRILKARLKSDPELLAIPRVVAD